MKIELNINAKEFEINNYIIGEIQRNLAGSSEIRKRFDVTTEQVEDFDKFRRSIVKAFSKETERK